MSKYLSIKPVLIGWSMITCSNFTVKCNGIGWSSSLESLIYYSFAAKSPYLQLSVKKDITMSDISFLPLHIKLDFIIWNTLLNYEVACKDTGCYPFYYRSIAGLCRNIRPRLFASAMYLSNEMQDEGLQCKRYNYLYAVTMWPIFWCAS